MRKDRFDIFKSNWILLKEKGCFIMIMLWIEHENIKKYFEGLVCQVNSYSCMRCFSMKLKIILSFCFIVFV